jgi:hypothetical protein
MDAHEIDILSSRLGGFGGSDAQLFSAVAKCDNLDDLGITHRRRIAVAMGLQTPDVRLSTPEMQAGHDFEDIVSVIYPDYEREHLIEAQKTLLKFRYFAHADFYKAGHVLECKKSMRLNSEKIAKHYKWQLQWYYLLGVERVTLVADGTDGFRLTDIAPDDDLQDIMLCGINKLEQEVRDGWQPTFKDLFDGLSSDNTDIFVK